MSAKQNIRAACGLLKSKTSVTKALLKERAKDKEREEAKAKNKQLSVRSKSRCPVVVAHDLSGCASWLGGLFQPSVPGIGPVR